MPVCVSLCLVLHGFARRVPETVNNTIFPNSRQHNNTRRLKPGGKLVYWLPVQSSFNYSLGITTSATTVEGQLACGTIDDQSIDELLPTHPRLHLQSVSRQALTAKFHRLLVTMVHCGKDAESTKEVARGSGVRKEAPWLDFRSSS